MEEYVKNTLKDFIGENWSAFVQFCADRGEGLADECYKELGGDPDE